MSRCAECQVGQGDCCACADRVPSMRRLAAAAVVLVAGAALAGLGLGHLIYWVTL